MASNPLPTSPLLLCYDGSDDAKRAIGRAAALFAARPAIVLVVWQRAAALLSYGWPGVTIVPDIEELDETSQAAALKLAAEGATVAEEAGLAAEPLEAAAIGPVWSAIVGVADEREAAAIVLGSRGLSGIKSVVLGSVSSAVIHHADQPVLVVRHSD